jgi:hypothetical protein
MKIKITSKMLEDLYVCKSGYDDFDLSKLNK